MNAFEHSGYCRDIASSLYRELLMIGQDVTPVFHSTATYTWNKGSVLERDDITFCYVHPEDKEIRRIEDFKFPHREL